MDISYYETRDVEKKRIRVQKIWNVCKIIIAIIILIVVISGSYQYLMQELV